MNLNQALAGELQYEAAGTRKLLTLVPMDQLGWKPHEKAMSLYELAVHVAELVGWTGLVLNTPELDFHTFNYQPSPISSNEELVAIMEKGLSESAAALEAATPETFAAEWTLRAGEHIILTLPKAQVVRSVCLNHMIHHRGQLSTYLRILGIAIPGMYGPSADDGGMMNS